MGILVWQVLSTGFFSKQTLLFSTLVNLYQFYYLFPLRNRTTDVATQLMWKKGKGEQQKIEKKPRKNVWPHRINGSSSVLHLHVHTAFLSLFSEPIISISTNSLSGMFSYSHDDDKALWNWGLYPQQFLSVPWGKFLNLLLVLHTTYT